MKCLTRLHWRQWVLAGCLSAVALSSGYVPGTMTSAQAAIIKWKKNKSPPSTGRLLAIGRLFERQGHKNEAIKVYHSILAQNPNHAEAKQRLAALTGTQEAAAQQEPQLAQAKPKKKKKAKPTENALAKDGATKQPEVSGPTTSASNGAPELKDPSAAESPSASDVASVNSQPKLVRVAPAGPEEDLDEATRLKRMREAAEQEIPIIVDIMPEQAPIAELEPSSEPTAVAESTPSSEQVSEPVEVAELSPGAEPVEVAELTPNAEPEPAAIPEIAPTVEPEPAPLAPATLASLCPDAQGEVLEFVRQLDNNDVEVRDGAIMRLGDLGQAAEAALPALRKMLHVESPYHRIHAIIALWKINQEIPSEIERLGEDLQNEDEALRALTIDALAQIGSETAPVFTCSGTMDGPEGSKRVTAAEALFKLEENNLISCVIFLRALSEGDKDARFLAAYVLSDLAPQDDATVTALTRVLDDKEDSVRAAAAFALGSIGPAAAKAVPVLVEIVRTSKNDPDLRMTAFHSLENIDPAAASRCCKKRTVDARGAKR